ncbi:winged helix-turn-helix transcriptional regulator [Nesterenkonia sp. PF2B19]|uniref:winged helix-turn-helix transcriptional regulator n=1 Tax=Nesterenkonia sp. PF2B19 TaxID=1881858 RepID=UPI000872B87E|nr:helix-turn-helix domain-containing protein [Nesterenkonia sp. PF2B19]OSM42296.1 hypothetical protein BCY76_015250 [Nesterenkonia sp. PF2B19]
MTKDYGQFCGLARAARALGERWALLIVRDLSVGPRRFKDIHEGLPGVPTSVLTTRLRELEQMEVLERRAAEQPGGGVLYALTAYGAELTPILDRLGRWGAQRMSAPEPGEILTSSSLAAALRAAYRPGIISAPTTYLIHAGAASAWASAGGEDLDVGAGIPVCDPDVVIHAGPQLRLLLAGRLSPEDAVTSGELTIEGPAADLEVFAQAFHVPLALTVSPTASEGP